MHVGREASGSSAGVPWHTGGKSRELPALILGTAVASTPLQNILRPFCISGLGSTPQRLRLCLSWVVLSFLAPVMALLYAPFPPGGLFSLHQAICCHCVQLWLAKVPLFPIITPS